jgi:predicted DNA-binding transcriptional regulator AlpA
VNRHPASRVATQPRRGLDRAEAATYVGVSQVVFDQMVNDGRLPEPIEINGERVWDLVRLDKAFDALSGLHQARNPWK